MAKVRIGFSTQFELENEKVGIGTDSALDTLHVTGDIIAHNIDISGGITTVTTYDGFIEKEVKLTNPDINLNSKSHALSGEIVIEGEVTVSSGTTFTSGPENLTVTDNFTLPGITNDKPSVGTMRFNVNLAALEFYTGVEWRAVNYRVDMGNAGRAVFMGGDASQDVIDYFNMSTLGNAKSFGEIAGGTSRIRGDACSSQTRGLLMAGFSPAMETDIDYITLASEGNSIKFGDLTDGGGYMPACLSSSTRGIKAGGVVSPAYKDTIQYVEINTLGDGVDFGTLTTTNCRFAGLSNATRGLFGGGYNQGSTGPAFSRIDEITIASKGNAISFRNLDRAVDALCAASNSVRGVWAGGTNKTPGGDTVKSLSYITIASGSDAVDFGDLARATNQAGATGSQRRVLVAGGGNPTVPETVFVEYSSLGNAMDFGELTAARRFIGGCSDSHGGLGGF